MRRRTPQTPTPTAPASPPPAAGPTQRKAAHAVIVGGGPAGLATMLLLRARGLAERITVLERSSPRTERPMAPVREFAYLLDWRGARLLDALPGLRARVEAAAEPLKPSVMHMFAPDGARTRFDMQTDSAGMEGLYRLLCWTRRSALLDAFEAHFEAGRAARSACEVAVLRGVSCRDVRFSDGLRPIRVAYVDGDGVEVTLEADLLVGADGLRSVVRGALQREFEAGKVAASGSGPGFAMEMWASPAVGLLYKSLRIPSGKVYMSDRQCDEPEVEMTRSAYIFRGKSSFMSRRPTFNLACLPVGPLTSFGRLGTVVLKPGHPLWRIRDAEACYTAFEAALPQLDVRRMIPPEEMQRFAAADAAAFPPIQRAGGFVAHVGSGAVALVGDAVHCFPPDMGQGVNCSLEDVVELCDGLEREGLHGGVDFYQRRRDGDIRSLMRIMRLAHPFQYQQSMLGLTLYYANRTLRTKLWKLAPTFFKPQITVLMSRKYSYSEILKMADDTTFRIYGLSALLLGVIGGAVLLARIACAALVMTYAGSSATAAFFTRSNML